MKAAGPIIALVLILLAIAWFHPACRIERSFNNFERNARKVITGPELAAWGNVLLAQYPTNTTLRLAELGTNFPTRLRGLVAPELGPRIVVYEAGPNAPGWVMVYWGSGVLGHCGFEIGPTNFTGDRAHHRWQDGVYSFNDHGNGSQ